MPGHGLYPQHPHEKEAEREEISYLLGVQVFQWGPEIKRWRVNLTEVGIMNSQWGNIAPISCDPRGVPCTLGAF